MQDWGWYVWVYLIAVIALTGVALVIDLRVKRIPNWLTLPMFALGWIYQGAVFGGPGLLDGLKGFALGFGMLFVLWIIAGGGAGDVKLMGALGVWLGFYPTFFVIIISTAVIAVYHCCVLASRLLKGGFKSIRRDLEAAKAAQQPGKARQTTHGRLKLPYAVPVALATWVVLFGEAHIAKRNPFKPANAAAAQAQRDHQRS